MNNPQEKSENPFSESSIHYNDINDVNIDSPPQSIDKIEDQNKAKNPERLNELMQYFNKENKTSQSANAHNEDNTITNNENQNQKLSTLPPIIVPRNDGQPPNSNGGNDDKLRFET